MEIITTERNASTNVSHSATLDYNVIHGYIATFLCCIGIVMNVLNFITWFRCERQTAVTFSLKILSLVDLLVVISYLPVALYIFVITTDMHDTCHSKGMMWFMLICNHVFILSCTWSVWIALLVATVRCVHVVLSRQSFSLPRIRKLFVLLFILFQMEGVPYYFFYKVEDMSENTGCVTYWIVRTELAMKSETYHDCLFTLLALTRGVIPCVLFMILSFVTIHLVMKRRRLQNQVAADNSDVQTTIMLFVIALLFFLCMVSIIAHPFIVLGRSRAIAQYFWFLDSNYVLFNVNFLAILQISNCSLNIIIYIVMCEPFRASLRKTLCWARQPGYTEIADNQDVYVSVQNAQQAQEPVRYRPINLIF